MVLLTAFLPLCPTTGVAVEFATPVSYPVGTSPTAVVIADFNGDGKVDLAVANSGSGNVSILLGNGDGTYKPAVNFDAGMATPTSIEVADFNNDGIQDLAVWTLSGPIGSSLSILLGKGDGTFQAPKTTALPAAIDQATLDLVIADFNLDQKTDLAVLVHDANAGTSRIFLLAGNGDGTFQAPQQSSDVLSTQVGSNVKYLVAADFNNDARPDLAAQVSEGVEILLGQGDGTFHAGPTVPTATGLVATDFKVGDFSVDGKADLLVKTDGPNKCSLKPIGTVSRLSLFLGNGDGSFQSEQLIDQSQWCTGLIGGEHLGPKGTAIGASSAGDFNGDGRPDLQYQSTNYTDPASTTLLIGRKDGVFSIPVPIVNSAPWGLTVVAKDLNGDKLSDLIYLDSANNAVGILLNDSPTSGADLAILGNDANGSVYSAVIMNDGPDAATAVAFRDTLPNSINFVSATTTQGSCTHANGVVTCAIGPLAPGFDVTVNIPVTTGPNATDGTVTNNMNVIGTEPDLAPANNMAVQNTGVFSVTVQTTGSGSGIVTSNPGGINCGTVCSQHYLSGSYVALIPTASSGSQFSGWSGDCNFPAPNGCASNISSDMSVTAKFDMAATPPPPSGGGGAFAWWDLCGMLLFGLRRRLSASPLNARA